MSKKYPFSSVGKANSSGYNYKKLVREEKRRPTKKQLDFIEKLEAICEEKEITLEGLKKHIKTNRQASGWISTLLGILNRNGFDSYGNPIKTYNIKDKE